MDKKSVLTNLMWKFLERTSTQGIQFVIQIFLARLLSPEEFGMIAIVMVFITIANVFVQRGFNTALIQRKDTDELDFSSVLYLSLFITSILYLLLFFTAPLIASFYMEPQLTLILRVLSLTLFIGAFNSIQNAYITKNMMFRKLFLSSLGSVVVSGTLGVILAYQGYGVWALVIQQLINQLMITGILWFTVEWRPTLEFSINRILILFSYGWKLLVSSLLDTFYTETRTLVVGRIYSPSMLGYYNRGQQFPHFIVSNINGTIQSVMFPTLSGYQDDTVRVKEMVRRSIVTSSFVMFPMMIGLAIVAEPLVKILLTSKWLPAVPFLQIFCVSYALIPIHTANLQAINALGRSDIFLKLEIIKKIVGFAILGISIPFGVYAIAWGTLLVGIISTFINSYPNSKLLNYSYIDQWRDLMPSLLISLAMGAIVYSLSYLGLSAGLLLVLQVVVGALTYLLLAKVFKVESFEYLLATIKSLDLFN